MPSWISVWAGSKTSDDWTACWLAQVADARVHRETKRRPVDLHAEECPHLLPLPEKPYDTAEVVYRTVSTEGWISYRQNVYSVPWQHIARVLPVRITECEVIIYGPNLEELVRRRVLVLEFHDRLPHGERLLPIRHAGLEE